MTRFRFVVPIVLPALLGSCSSDRSAGGDGEDTGAGEPWAVTAWGETFEIFAECDPLAVGEVSTSFTHVTILERFPPLRAGAVTAILRGPAGAEEFRQETPKRDGIWSIEIAPNTAGEFELVYRVEAESASEEIPAGRVRVGNPSDPGGLVVVDAAPAAVGDVPFLKEQQWRTEFATEWVSFGSIRESVRGPGRVRAAAGGDVVLSAPLDGRILSNATIHVGQAVRRSAPVLSLAPRAGGDRNLAELEAELDIARRRLARLEELVLVQAVSVAEVEAARARVASLEPQLAAATGDGEEATAAVVRSPFDGKVAEVLVVPGQSVAAGDPLVRVVRTDPLWIEVDLRPADASQIADAPVGLIVRTAASSDASPFAAERVRLVAKAPVVNPRTGTIAAIFEIAGSDLPLGQVAEVEILLAQERPGIVVPSSSLVDDAGIPVVYLQVEGESFARREVSVVARQGDLVLVEGLQPGERLVTRGGAAIRRASLASSALEGHVH